MKPEQLTGFRAWLPLLLGMVVAVPTLALPFMLDDWFHLSALEIWFGGGAQLSAYYEGWSDPWGLPSCFRFFAGDNLAFIESGLVPWWVDPELRIIFLRPLSSLTHAFDHQVFGANPFWHHLHSVLWYVAAVVIVSRLYRQVLPAFPAYVATLMFAIDDAHWYPVAWIANRNAIVALVPALLGLMAHIRWQKEGWKPGLPLSALGLALGLAGGEAALGVFALLFAFQVWGPSKRRVVGLVPALVVGLVWAAIYKSYAFGTHGSGLYIDPSADFGAYLRAATTRFPILAGAQILGLPADVAFVVREAVPFLVAGGVVSLIGGWWAMRWVSDQPGAAELRWLVPGGLLALVPVMATFPIVRLLLVPGVGLFPLLAVVLVKLVEQRRHLLGAFIGIPHLGLAPLAWFVLTYFSLQVNDEFTRLKAAVGEYDGEDVVLLGVSDPGIVVYLPMEASYRDIPRPRMWHILSLAATAHEVTWKDEHSFELEMVDAYLGEALFERLFRNFDLGPLEVGYTVQSDGLTIRVLETDSGGATRLAVDSVRPLSELVFLTFDEQGFVEVDVSVGERAHLPYEPGPLGI